MKAKDLPYYYTSIVQPLAIRLVITLLILSWLGTMLLSTKVGVSNYWWLLALPAMYLFRTFQKIVYIVRDSEVTGSELGLFLAFIFVWGLHFFQILVPETGFDALWYHLPIVKQLVETNGFVYLPDLYQSVNPLLGEVLFSYGYSILGVVGVKMVAWFSGLSLILVTYALARYFMTRYWGLWTALGISLFQVVAWQSSSAYVDVIKAFFEVSFLFLLFRTIQKYQLLDLKPKKLRLGSFIFLGLVLGASLATKLFSVFLLIPTLLILSLLFSYRKVFLFLLASILPVSFFYWRAFHYLGSPFYSFGHHISKLSNIGGESNLWAYLWQRIGSFPTSVSVLTFSTDYVFLAGIIFLPLLLWYVVRMSIKQVILLIWIVFSWGLWWFLPPISTRYALSGFIVLYVLEMSVVSEYVKQGVHHKRAVILVLFLSSVWGILPRLAVFHRSLPYLVRRQNQQQYLEQFLDRNIDRHLKDWYRLDQ